MSNQKSAKGNPASHRMSNANRKNRCEVAHRRSADRKLARRKAQDEAHKMNKLLGVTPWEVAKLTRTARRLADPAVQRRRALNQQG